MGTEQEIKTALQGFGLNSLEIRIYLSLLSTGFSKVSILSKKTGISRSKCYELLSSLAEKGIVNSAITRGVKHYEAIHPQQLLPLLHERAQLLQDVIPHLVKIRKSTKVKPKAEFYEGKQGLMTILADCLKSSSSKTEILTLGCGRVFDDLRIYFPDFIKERVRRGIPVRVLQERTEMIEGLVEKDTQEFREIRFLPWKYSINTMIQIYCRKIAFLTFKKDNYVGVVIENEDIVATHRLMFNSIWNLAIKPQKKKQKASQDYEKIMREAINTKRYLVIDKKRKPSQVKTDTLIGKLKAIKKSNINLCYETHLGFALTDNYFLKHILEKTSKRYVIHPSFIDERERSGGKIYRPTTVCAEGRLKRIHQNSLQYLSQIPFGTRAITKNNILDAYQQLSFPAFNEIRMFFEERPKEEYKTLAEFLVSLHLHILHQQIDEIITLTYKKPILHKYDIKTQSTGHRLDDHRSHDILYLPLHRFCFEVEETLLEQFCTQLKGLKKPELVIIPLDTKLYFDHPFFFEE